MFCFFSCRAPIVAAAAFASRRLFPVCVWWSSRQVAHRCYNTRVRNSEIKKKKTPLTHSENLTLKLFRFERERKYIKKSTSSKNSTNNSLYKSSCVCWLLAAIHYTILPPGKIDDETRRTSPRRHTSNYCANLRPRVVFAHCQLDKKNSFVVVLVSRRGAYKLFYHYYCWQNPQRAPPRAIILSLAAAAAAAGYQSSPRTTTDSHTQANTHTRFYPSMAIPRSTSSCSPYRTPSHLVTTYILLYRIFYDVSRSAHTHTRSMLHLSGNLATILRN